MMSLEEVEAQIRAQAKKPAQTQAVPSQQQHYHTHPLEQRPQHVPVHQGFGETNQEFVTQTPIQHQPQPVQILQRSNAPLPPAKTSTIISSTAPAIISGSAQPQPIQILQNPKRMSGDYQRQTHIGQSTYPVSVGSRQSIPVITHPQQLVNMTEDQRASFLAEEAKRAKRNHKIFLLSKDNGLMTPQDKNFITRVQLQQLITATGNPNEHGTDAALSEDFYYQVHSQIRGGPRQHPNQPLSNFAQTYLFQTGGRPGNMRRQARGGDNHIQRMEQQVQRAVEAAKNKPKNKQLVLEGSLGKISFSNAKTPKPLLNIKRADIGNDINRPGSSARISGDRKSQQAAVSGPDRKTVLRDIENVYNTLMQMEDHERQRPPQNVADEIDLAFRNLQVEWDAKFEELNRRLWRDLKVHEPVDLKARGHLSISRTHPFIAFLSFNKGKKAIPRIFRQMTQQQRTISLTMIVVHLDRLDVVSQAVISGDIQPPAIIREKVDLFSIAVMPSLFAYLSDAGLDIVTSVLSIIVDMTNVDIDARTRIGVSMLTMVLSRAELIKQASTTGEQEWEIW
jgi:DNA topoisomerase 2-associated protein PAT1